MKKVLYLSMPFAAPNWGSLALGTLKAIGKRAGIESDVLYLNIPFAMAIGESLYHALREKIASEVCFTSALFPDAEPATLWQQGIASYEGEKELLVESERNFIDIATRHAPWLLDKAMAETPWDDYDIVGFTTGYHQLTSSLALATRIRSRFPEKIIVFGGASCDGEMGPALLKGFDVIDVVVSGEADSLIVPLIKALRSKKPVNRLPRVYARASNRVAVADSMPVVFLSGSQNSTPAHIEDRINLDDLPVPDYDDYFAQIGGVALEKEVRIPFESSRGCWWGQKHLCSFCGLNGTNLAYRAKSPEKVLSELRTLYLRYQKARFSASDNIFDMAYFKTFLPGLKLLHDEYGIEIFYETKSNLKREQVTALMDAGVTMVQPGIESFSDHILQLMDKGTTGLNQVRFLRDCNSVGMKTQYGILWSNPGETAQDYTKMLQLIPFIRHLQPPKYTVPIVLERFSPYFLSPEKFGIRNVRPAPIYPIMFGGRPLDYERIAYIFSYDHDFDHNEELKEVVRKLIAAVEEWEATYQPLSLVSSEIDDVLYIADRREPKPVVLRLTGIEKAVFDFCDLPRPESEISRVFPDATAEWLRQFLEQMVSRRLMLLWEGDKTSKYMSLPIGVSSYVMYEGVFKPMMGAGAAA